MGGDSAKQSVGTKTQRQETAEGVQGRRGQHATNHNTTRHALTRMTTVLQNHTWVEQSWVLMEGQAQGGKVIGAMVGFTEVGEGVY